MYFVERLTLRSWFLEILPRSFRETKPLAAHCCLVFDGSKAALVTARLLGRILGWKVERICFRLIDVRDDKGILIEERQRYIDLFEIQKLVFGEPAWKRLVQDNSFNGPFKTYLEKELALLLRRKVLLIQICAWYAKKFEAEGEVVLFIERLPWLWAVERYASAYNVVVAPINLNWGLQKLLRSVVDGKVRALLRALRNAVFEGYRFLYANIGRVRWRPLLRDGERLGSRENLRGKQEARVAVQRLGNLNLDHPELNSDFFFMQPATLRGSDVLVLSSLPVTAADEESLSNHGVGVVALGPKAGAGNQIPVFTCWPRLYGASNRFERLNKSVEARWARARASQYGVDKEYWESLFSRYGVKVYCTWYRYDGLHCAVFDGLRAAGGVTAIYPRAYSPNASPLTTVHTDICFAYSPWNAQLECSSGSVIAYHVAAGYIGDHRFPLLRAQADTVRKSLTQRGATHLLAYFDENSVDDSRWHTGHEFMRVNYEFLLGKVLENPWLGLVIKPKAPSTLRRRLGIVADLLKQAEATGRCYLHGEGTFQSVYPPAAAALAADVAVHGHLSSGTAGMEAALAGVPTLLLDREGWPHSPFYGLGVGRVVFSDWKDLWKTLEDHWSRPDGVPGFGDWSLMLDELDPFRDGRAAERMGTYLKWILDGFKAGLDRGVVMADAAERYCRLWGWDKITEVNSQSCVVHGTVSKKAENGAVQVTPRVIVGKPQGSAGSQTNGRW